MKSVLLIVAYLLGTVLLGAALAPWLFRGLHALEPWALANGLLRFEPYRDQVLVRGPLAVVIQADFVKIAHRAFLLAALVLLWPAIRALRVRRWSELQLRRDPRAGRHFLRGFLTAGGVVAVMGVAYLFLDYYHLKDPLPWRELPRLALTAGVVGILEECLFRGAILGMLLRTLRPYPALAWTTFIFGIIHYLRPGEEAVVLPVRWSSGFALLPQMFHLFGEPVMLLASLTTLLVLGWTLGYVRLRTGSLWMSIGLHAGVVFVKMAFAKFTKRDEVPMPWVGPELQIGIVPVVLLLLAFYLLWQRLQDEELLPDPRPRA